MVHVRSEAAGVFEGVVAKFTICPAVIATPEAEVDVQAVAVSVIVQVSAEFAAATRSHCWRDCEPPPFSGAVSSWHDKAQQCDAGKGMSWPLSVAPEPARPPLTGQ